MKNESSLLTETHIRDKLISVENKGWKQQFESCSRGWYKEVRPHGQAVKTSPFHGGNTSSNLVGVIRDAVRAYNFKE